MNKFKTEIKWGLIFVVTQIAWFLIEGLMGWHSDKIAQHDTMTMLFIPIAFLVYFLALRDKRTTLGGTMTFKEGFIAGLIITAVVTILTPLVQYLFSTVIAPDFFANKISYSVETGLMTQPKADAFFNLPSFMVMSAIFAPVMGILTSAIMAFVCKTKQAA